MAEVRSKTLAFATSVGTATTLLYTVPPGETALVKWLQVYNGSAAAITASLFCNYGSGNVRALRMDVPAGRSIQVQLWWALAEGVTVSTGASAGSAADFHLFGAELEGVAD